jgi:hypothetical protein
VLLLTPCALVLLLARLALLGFQIRMVRNNFARDLKAVANIVAANSTAAVAFGDAQAATAMLRAQHGHLAEFLTQDPNGKLLPDHFCNVSEQLALEQSAVASEVRLLSRKIDHLKEIVAMQATKVSGQRFALWILAGRLPPRTAAVAADSIDRYLLQEGDDPPQEFTRRIRT